jgi:ribosomal protein S18 acetylase RimI-like enzyme
MQEKAKGLTKWIPSENLRTAAELCEVFNKKKIYEIFGEYCGLTEQILRERKACAWLYYEDGMLSGFALGRKRRATVRIGEAFVFEEAWGPCDGNTTELGVLGRKDQKRAFEFKKSVCSLDSKLPRVLRAATDNQFAHTVARQLTVRWVNGLVIAEKKLESKFKLSIPAGYKLRMFEDGDESCMSEIHREVFDEKIPAEEYRAWATVANCRTVIATHRGNLVGFIIAEKRRCGSLGDFNIAIKTAHQHKGVGSALLRTSFNIFLEMKVKKVIADYLMLNAHAHILYYKNGFRPKRAYNYFLM